MSPSDWVASGHFTVTARCRVKVVLKINLTASADWVDVEGGEGLIKVNLGAVRGKRYF